MSPTGQHARKQSRQKFASSHPTTGANTAEIQVAGLSPRFLFAHSAIYNVFNFQPYLIRRSTLRQFRTAAYQAWAAATVAA
jgi:hypothetical protein